MSVVDKREKTWPKALPSWTKRSTIVSYSHHSTQLTL